MNVPLALTVYNRLFNDSLGFNVVDTFDFVCHFGCYLL